MSIFNRLILIVILVSVMSGCGEKSLTEPEYIARATQSYQSGDILAAIINLKNALKINPSNPDTRMSLGRHYLELKDGVSAEKELERALKLGSNDSQLLLDVVTALRIQNKDEKIVKLYNIELDKVDKSNARQAAVVSESLLALSNLEAGENLMAKAYEIFPDSKETQIARIKYQIVKSNIKQAISMLNDYITAYPKYDEAKLILGNIYFKQENFQNAVSLYDKVIKNNQNKAMSLPLFNAYIGVIRSQLSLKNWPEAKVAIGIITEKAPSQFITKYYDGVLSYEQKQYASAKEKLLAVLNAVPDHLQSQLLLGSVFFAEQSYEQASAYLTSFLNSVPTHVNARKLLAAVKIKQKRPAEAVQVLLPIAGEGEDDSKLLTMIGKSAIDAGNLDMGERFLKKAIAVENANTAAIRSELAKIYLAQGKEASALSELVKMAKSHPKQSLFMQALLQIRQKKFSKASRTAKKLKSDFPDDPAVEMLIAQIGFAQNKISIARKHLFNAITLKDNFAPAILGLARLDFNAGDLGQAAINYRNVINIDPENDVAMIGMGQIEEANGNVSEAIGWLEKARKRGRNSLVAHLLLTRYYFGKNENEKAIKIAEEVAAKFPENPAALKMFAISQIKQSRIKNAIDTLEGVSKQYPKDADALVRLAALYAMDNDLVKARSTNELAIEVNRNDVRAYIGLFNIDLKNGKFLLAEKTAKQLIKQFPGNAVGQILSGDLSMHQKKYKSAARFYKTAFKIRAVSQTVVKISNATALSGDKKEAIKPLVKWLKKNPEDIRVIVLLGNAYQSTNQVNKAIAVFEDGLKKQPENAVLLNNVAWMYFEEGDKRAIDYAEKAIKISPRSAAVTDTLGWILVQLSDINRGTRLLERAVELSGGNAEISLHLAIAYEKQQLNQKSIEVLNKVINHQNVARRIKSEADELLQRLTQ